MRLNLTIELTSGEDGRDSNPIYRVLVGVDQSTDLLAEAERRRGEILATRLCYYKHDLRKSLPESGFDAALNIFSSLGYGMEADDLAILSTLRRGRQAAGRRLH